MPITDHVAILAHSSLDVPRINKLNPSKPAAFFAQVAFPPAAGADLQALLAAVAPGGNLAGQELPVQVNSQMKKPLPGVPGDWLVTRASTQFAPYVADGAGQQLDQSNPATHGTIKTHFYAGKKVRAALSAYAWSHAATNRRGVSFNLQGVMAAEDGERLNIGQGVVVNAFQQYADPSKAAAVTPVPGANAQTVAQGPNGNPFAAQTQVTASTAANASTTAQNASANPFAQAQQANQSNPFAQQA